MGELKLKEIVLALPEEERVELADALMISLLDRKAEVEAQWIEIAQQRLNDIQSGKGLTVSMEEVFKKYRQK